MLGILLLIGIAISVIVLDGLLGGIAGLLVGLFSCFVLRRGPWERVVTMHTLFGAVGFTILELATLGLTQLKVQIHQYASPAVGEFLSSLYNHTFRCGFAGALIAPILYELFRGPQPKSLS